MSKVNKSVIALMLAVSFAGTMSFAEATGEAVYKSKCQSCHGATGTPSAGMAKNLGVKAANDPSVKKMSDAQLLSAVKNGIAKMKPTTGLTEQQMKDSVTYYKALGK